MAQPTISAKLSFSQSGLLLADLSAIIASDPELNHDHICAMAGQFEYELPTALPGYKFTEDVLDELDTCAPGSDLERRVEKQLHHNLAGLKEAQMMQALLNGALQVTEGLEINRATSSVWHAFKETHPDMTTVRVTSFNWAQRLALNTVANNDFLFYRLPQAQRASGGAFIEKYAGYTAAKKQITYIEQTARLGIYTPLLNKNIF